MRNYIILNGKNSNTITGLLISTLPPITKPKQRTQTEEIDGRDGDIVTKLGYSAYDKEIEIGLYGNFDIDEVIAYFNTEGTVVFSNESDKYYNYQILDQIDYEKLIRFKKAKVKMHVQPFKYPLEETPVEINIQNVTASGENIDLDNTAEAPLTINLKANTSQDGTPTPEAPVEVKTVTGGQEVVVCGKNLVDTSKAIIGKAWNNISNTAIAVVYIPCQHNTSYTLSFTAVSGTGVFYFGKANIDDTTATSAIVQATGTKTFTTDNATNYIGIQYNRTAITQADIEAVKVQLEKGSTATAYEPYQSQSYEINLGKNLFDKSTANLNKGVATANGGLYNSDINFSTDYIEVNSNGTYYTASGVSSVANRVYGAQYDSNKQYVGAISTNAGTRTFYISDTSVKYIRLTGLLEEIDTYQVERGSETTSYAPYKEPIELCKIGDYQDRIYKESDKWYIEKQIGKIVLDGSRSWTYIAVAQGSLFRNSNDMINNAIVDDDYTPISDYYKGTPRSAVRQNNSIIANVATTFCYLDIVDNRYTNANDFKAWLETIKPVFYYVLSTPEVTEITDTELIGQLEAIKTARSYDPTTHISQNTANKPFILNATAVQNGTDTATVDNEGNIYSKPTIDIEGSGIADIYLNGNQIFSIDLSIINECVINTTNLEAYNPTTNILMNRQVTGDYSNFKLNAGENQIKVSGEVTKATISDYTRWL